MPQNEPEQVTLMRELIELSAERSYMNAERTLSVWVRTALGLMILGLAVDRFSLIVGALPGGPTDRNTDAISDWVGVALVALGVVMALATGLRFRVYTLAYQRHHRPPFHHHPALGPFFALMVGVFGVALLVIMLVVAP